MDYNEYEDQAAEYMRLAIPLMKKYGVAMTPANYAVWYEYVSGNNAGLNQEINKLIDLGDQRLNDQESKSLYDRFFDKEKDRAELIELRQDIRRILTEVLNYLTKTALTSTKSSEHLQDILTRFDNDLSQTELHTIVEEVLEETKVSLASGLELSEQLSEVVSEVQELKKEVDDAKQQAKTDMLTKLANRRAFDDALAQSTADTDLTGNDLCLIFGDLDRFKAINDKHGHLLGDQVLKMVANTLKEAVKGRDLVARFGGEEFAILLQNTNVRNAKKLAEEIRGDIASKRIQRKDTQESIGKVTMSFGVAHYYKEEGMESFLQRADRALYMSKRKGRNAVTEAQPPVI
jgi:diguanylate cyclase